MIYSYIIQNQWAKRHPKTKTRLSNLEYFAIQNPHSSLMQYILHIKRNIYMKKRIWRNYEISSMTTAKMRTNIGGTSTWTSRSSSDNGFKYSRNEFLLTLPMLRLRVSTAQGLNHFWKPSKTCHIGIHWTALAEYSQMRGHVPGFQSFIRCLGSICIWQIGHQHHKG